MMIEKFANLLTERVTLKNEGSDIGLALIVHDQIAFAGNPEVGMYIVENANLAPDSLDAIPFRACPDRRPIGKAVVFHQGVVAELQGGRVVHLVNPGIQGLKNDSKRRGGP